MYNHSLTWVSNSLISCEITCCEVKVVKLEINIDMQVANRHAQLYQNVGSYSGRVVFGGATPGFDDYTEDWGECIPREVVRTRSYYSAIKS